MLAAQLADMPYAKLLEQRLWSQLAAADAVAMLDHPRGDIAAHCCLRAAAADWLRLGLLLADGGKVGSRQLLPAGFVDQMARESPVHPGYGLGYRIEQYPAMGQVLVLETAGRQLLVAPGIAPGAAVDRQPSRPPAGLHRLLGAETAGVALPEQGFPQPVRCNNAGPYGRRTHSSFRDQYRAGADVCGLGDL